MALFFTLAGCYQPASPPGCETYKTLSAEERLMVKNSEKALLATGEAHDFSIKCILIGEGKGGRFVIFAAPVGKTAADMPTEAYAAKTTMDGTKVEYINLNHPFGPWRKVEQIQSH